MPLSQVSVVCAILTLGGRSRFSKSHREIHDGFHQLQTENPEWITGVKRFAFRDGDRCGFWYSKRLEQILGTLYASKVIRDCSGEDGGQYYFVGDEVTLAEMHDFYLDFPEYEELVRLAERFAELVSEKHYPQRVGV